MLPGVCRPRLTDQSWYALSLPARARRVCSRSPAKVGRCLVAAGHFVVIGRPAQDAALELLVVGVIVAMI